LQLSQNQVPTKIAKPDLNYDHGDYILH
jgi:hypothetical protein